MSIIFMDGFERGSLSQWTVDTGMAIISVGSSGFTGSYYVNNSGYAAEKTFSNSYSEIYISSKMSWNTGNAPYGGWQFYDSAHTLCLTIVVNSISRFFEIRRGERNGTLLATGSSMCQYNQIRRVEIYYKPANSGGVCTIRIDGLEDATYTGDSTSGLENVQTIRIGQNGGGIDGTNYDDIIVDDSNWLGNQYIQLLTPNASGDSTQWTPSTGNNYDCVNEVVASDTDYVSTNTADNLDLYNLTSMTGSIKSVTAINALARMSYYGTPTPSAQQIAIKSTGEYFSDNISPALSYQVFNHIWDQNPATSAAWLESEINALQVGVKAVT